MRDELGLLAEQKEEQARLNQYSYQLSVPTEIERVQLRERFSNTTFSRKVTFEKGGLFLDDEVNLSGGAREIKKAWFVPFDREDGRLLPIKQGKWLAYCLPLQGVHNKHATDDFIAGAERETQIYRIVYGDRLLEDAAILRPEEKKPVVQLTPWLEGDSLANTLATSPGLGLEAKAWVAFQLTAYLVKLHRQGYLLSDQKAQNTLLYRGERGFAVHIVDVGGALKVGEIPSRLPEVTQGMLSRQVERELKKCFQRDQPLSQELADNVFKETLTNTLCQLYFPHSSIVYDFQGKSLVESSFIQWVLDAHAQKGIVAELERGAKLAELLVDFKKTQHADLEKSTDRLLKNITQVFSGDLFPLSKSQGGRAQEAAWRQAMGYASDYLESLTPRETRLSECVGLVKAAITKLNELKPAALGKSLSAEEGKELEVSSKPRELPRGFCRFFSCASNRVKPSPKKSNVAWAGKR